MFKINYKLMLKQNCKLSDNIYRQTPFPFQNEMHGLVGGGGEEWRLFANNCMYKDKGYCSV